MLGVSNLAGGAIRRFTQHCVGNRLKVARRYQSEESFSYFGRLCKEVPPHPWFSQQRHYRSFIDTVDWEGWRDQRQPNLVNRNISNEDNLGFSVDLVANAKVHLQFLQMLHANGTTLVAPKAESLRRYKDLWLPFVWVMNSTLMKRPWLIPPADVAWLWHCHRLAPYLYVQYVKDTFDEKLSNLDPHPPFAFQENPITGGDEVFSVKGMTRSIAINMEDEEKAREGTRSLWESMYPFEPFFLREEEEEEATMIDGTALENTEDSSPGFVLGFDLLASAKRQSTFLWHVSNPQYQDDFFLEQAAANYSKFLQLKSPGSAIGNTKQVLIPTYQIDFMWHTHILTSLTKYEDDCKNLCGQIFNHNDAMNDRSEGSDRNQALAVTRKLWKETYGTDYGVEGGMYRGEPPSGYFRKDWGSHHQRGVETPEIAPDGRPTILPAPTQRPAPKMKDYVFGRPSRLYKAAYYHLATREAGNILKRRIDTKIGYLERDIRRAENQFFDWWTGASVELKRSLKEHQAAEQVLRSRMATVAPLGVAAGIPILEALLLLNHPDDYLCDEGDDDDDGGSSCGDCGGCD